MWNGHGRTMRAADDTGVGDREMTFGHGAIAPGTLTNAVTETH